jgi:hypothetical protein
MEVATVSRSTDLNPDVLKGVAAKFLDKLEALAEHSAERQQQEIDGLAELNAPALWDVNRRLHRESRGLQATHLLRGFELPQSCPEPDRQAAHLAALGGLPLADALKSYRIGHVCTIEAWLEAIEEVDLGADDRASCVAAISRFSAEYDDRIADLVSKEYLRHREQVTAETKRTGLEFLRDLLQGRPESAPELGYAIDLHHIGVVGSGLGVEETVATVAKELGQRYTLVPADDGLFMGWLGNTSNGVSPKRLLRKFQPPVGVTLAFGNVRFGYEGLKRTHREASGAHIVAQRRKQNLAFYDDVVLEVLALRDEKAAHEFIADVLPGLNGDDETSLRLRETLTAYFHSEQNRVATAASLGVHAVTVSRHLEQIEERIGHRVNKRRAELESALRLRSLFGKGADQDRA